MGSVLGSPTLFNRNAPPGLPALGSQPAPPKTPADDQPFPRLFTGTCSSKSPLKKSQEQGQVLQFVPVTSTRRPVALGPFVTKNTSEFHPAWNPEVMLTGCQIAKPKDMVM